MIFLQDSKQRSKAETLQRQNKSDFIKSFEDIKRISIKK